MGGKSGESRGDTRAQACRIALRVIPGSRREAIVGWMGDRLKVKVAAPPEDGRANQAVVALLAGALGVNDRAVTIVSGLTSPEKVVEVRGIKAAEIRTRLDAAQEK